MGVVPATARTSHKDRERSCRYLLLAGTDAGIPAACHHPVPHRHTARRTDNPFPAVLRAPVVNGHPSSPTMLL